MKNFFRVTSSFLSLLLIFYGPVPIHAEISLTSPELSPTTPTVDPLTVNNSPAATKKIAANTTTDFQMAGPLSVAESVIMPAAEAPCTTAMCGVTAGGTVSGIVMVQPNLTLNPSIRKIAYYLNGTQSGKYYAAPFTWGGTSGYDTRTLQDGNYTLSGSYTTSTGDIGFSIAFIVNNTTQDTTPPVISAVTSANITSSGATIAWTTNEASDSQVQYRAQGTTTWINTSLDTSLVTSHSVALTGLNPSAVYEYQVKSKDASGNQAVQSTVSNFTTLPANTTSPFLETGGVVVMEGESFFGATTVNGQTWQETSYAAGSNSKALLIGPDLGRSLGAMTGPRADFQFFVTTPGTYYVWIRGNAKDGTADSLHVGLNGQLVTGGDSVSNFAYATASWTNKNMAKARINFTISAPGVNTLNLWMREDGLLIDKIVLTQDANFFPTGLGPVESPRQQNDTTPPVISAVTSSSITSAGATISWTTDEASDSLIQYRGQGNTTWLNGGSDPSFVTNHSIHMFGLSGSRTYEYRVVSKDQAGNQATQATIATFTTLVRPTTAPVYMLGDSITAWTDWEYDLDRNDVINGGVAEEWTTQMLARLSQIYAAEPDLVFVMAGINDLRGGSSVQTTYDNYVQILENLAAQGITPVITSTTHVRESEAAANQKVTDLDLLLEAYAQAHGLDYIDLDAQVSENGHIKPEYTVDGIHLSASAYELWTTEVLAVLARHEADTTPPVISAVTSSNVTSDGATVTWTTDEASDSQVQYRVQGTTTWTNTTLDTLLVTSHSVVLTGLNADTAYEFQVKSKDQAGNPATQASISNFTTLSSTSSVVLDPATPTTVNTATLTVHYTADGVAKTKFFENLAEGENALTITEGRTTVHFSVIRNSALADFTWVNGMGSNLWSAAANWINGAIPGAMDTAIFGPYAISNAVIDAAVSLANLTIGSGYTGTITQQANVNVTNNFSQADGHWIDADPAAHTFQVGGSFALPAAEGSFNRFGALTNGYYQVRDVYDLQAMKNFLFNDFRLANDIDASSTARWNSGAGFDPIGKMTGTFHGDLDGTGFKIMRLAIDRPTEDYVGLFGVLDGSTVTDLGTVDETIRGGTNVGGLAGLQEAGSAIISSYTTGTVNGNSSITAGGLVGWNYGLITSSYSTDDVSVTGFASSAGGLVGINYNTDITSSYASGSVSGDGAVGGLAGKNSRASLISSSYAAGAVTGTDGTHVGGLVGWNDDSAITSSYATGSVLGGHSVGGLAGTSSSFYLSASISSSYATGQVSGNSDIGGLVGTNSSASISSSYAAGGVDGDYEAGGLVGSNHDSTITASYASGSVSGNGDIGGLVGSNDSATITSSYAAGNVIGNTNVGGLAGGNNSSSINDSYSTGSVTGNSQVGGLAGSNDGSSVITTSYATGNVTGSGTYIGGLVGLDFGAISSSYSTGNVTGGVDTGGLIGYHGNGTLSNNWWYNTVNTTGVGEGSSSGVTKAAAATDFIDPLQAVYVGATPWDFSNVWDSFSNTLPHLKWEYWGATAPVISLVSASGITETEATVHWTTHSASDSQVQYRIQGTTTWLDSPLLSPLLLAHSVILTGLNPNTIYEYRVRSRDAQGNLAVQATISTLTTGLLDITPPVISNVNLFDLSSTAATIFWETDEPSDSQVEYRVQGTTGWFSTNPDLSLTRSHWILLAGLAQDTVYEYRIKSKDQRGNLAVQDGPSTFRTLENIPPVISGVTTTNITPSSATFGWTTNEPATSRVAYRVQGTTLWQELSGNAYVQSHSITLSDLSPDTVYEYQVSSKDRAGNQAQTAISTFKTARFSMPPTTLIPPLGRTLGGLQFPAGTSFVDVEEAGQLTFLADAQALYIATHSNASAPEVVSAVAFGTPILDILAVPDGSGLFVLEHGNMVSQIKRRSRVWRVDIADPLNPVLALMAEVGMQDDGSSDEAHNGRQLTVYEDPVNGPMITVYFTDEGENFVESCPAGGGVCSMNFSAAYISTDMVYRYGNWIMAANAGSSGIDLNFTPLDFSRTPTSAPVAFVSGKDNLAFVSLKNGSVAVYDLDQVNAVNGQIPVVKTIATQGADPTYNLIYGDRLAVLDSTGLVEIFDITDPLNPSLVDSVTVPGARRIDHDGTNLYAVTGAEYRILGPAASTAFNEAGGQVVMEGESFFGSTTVNGQSWQQTNLASGSNGKALLIGPDLGRVLSSITGPRADFKFYVNTPGTFYVWLRGNAKDGTSDSVHVGLNGQWVPGGDSVSNFAYGTPSWSNKNMAKVRVSFTVTTPGENTLNLWMREDGLLIDKIVLTQDANYVPTGIGPVESGRVLETDTIPPFITAVTSTNVTSSGATITWTTNEPSDSQVQYRVQGTSAWLNTALDTSFVTNHSIALTGLNPNTAYEYQVKSKDKAGNLATQATISSFTTSTAPSGDFVGVTPGATVSGVVTIGPNLTVHPGIRKVAYYLNGAKSGKVYQTPFYWGGPAGDGTSGLDTRTLADGPYTLTMAYTDGTGDHSAAISFTVNNRPALDLKDQNLTSFEGVRKTMILGPLADGQGNTVLYGYTASSNLLSNGSFELRQNQLTYIPHDGFTGTGQIEVTAVAGTQQGEATIDLQILAPVITVPDDPYLSDQYGLTITDALRAWNLSAGSGIAVAIIDTGIFMTHPDLDGSIFINPGEIAGDGIDNDSNGFIDDVHGWDFINFDNDPSDDYGHGTHVAGIVAAEKNNGTGGSGIAPEASLLAIKALNADGSSDGTALPAAIRYAVSMGARVINMSLGGFVSAGNAFVQAMQEAVDEAYAAGVVVVASAGNDNADVVNYVPASLDHVITVSATNGSDVLATYGGSYISNYGAAIDVAAPGQDIFSTYWEPSNSEAYAYATGTSMSAPFVSGLAALMLSQSPNATYGDVLRRLQFSSQDLGAAGWDPYYGWGRIDAFKALSYDYYAGGMVKTQWLEAPDENGWNELFFDESGYLTGGAYVGASALSGFGARIASGLGKTFGTFDPVKVSVPAWITPFFPGDNGAGDPVA